ncbi:tyrosine-type recombinase/integrase [Archaeoglobus veneficus]|uniref:Integrase family protein n=1 Tax=Archaeoglobus veneficus (strain DSM 11195 / SNP6) TaxID=693661 RepID=F2KRI7_ARCVS|nr:tyrosine-type recombinase/integrase [Archaeoglobus veneficus]AEA46752.1 hypothetical protein Arcve_0734 [Archaeoglobus veneficus SNP6]
MGPPRFELGSPAPKAEIERFTQNSAEIKVDERISREYIQYRFTKSKTDGGRYWITKIQKDLMEKTKGILSRRTLIEFQNWYMSEYNSYDVLHKYYTYTKSFLEYVYKTTGNPLARDLKEVLDKPQRPSKKINPILIREEDVKNVIRAIYNLPRDPHNSEIRDTYAKIKYIANVLFAAYTGQRPEATISKLTFQDFERALSRNPPMLWVPEEKDKESFPHWVPLHPVVVEWLRAVLDYRHLQQQKPRDDVVFPYNSIRKAFTRIDIKAVHTGRKITYSHLRKFFEQMCNNVLNIQLPDGRVVPAVHPGLRDYIMAHNTGSLDVQSYDGKLPSEIYEQYMAAWGKVNLVPEEVRLEELLKAINSN